MQPNEWQEAVIAVSRQNSKSKKSKGIDLKEAGDLYSFVCMQRTCTGILSSSSPCRISFVSVRTSRSVSHSDRAPNRKFAVCIVHACVRVRERVRERFCLLLDVLLKCSLRHTTILPTSRRPTPSTVVEIFHKPDTGTPATTESRRTSVYETATSTATATPKPTTTAATTNATTGRNDSTQ